MRFRLHRFAMLGVMFLFVLQPATLAATPQLVGGDGEQYLSKGEPGLAILGYHQSPSGSLTVLVRNNTDQRIYEVGGTVTYKDDAGKLTSVAQMILQDFSILRSGQIGTIEVQFDTPPTSGKPDFAFTAATEPGPTNLYLSDLRVQEASNTGASILGILVNKDAANVKSPISVYVTCVNEQGTITHAARGSAGGSDAVLKQGETIPFEVAFHSADCPHFIVTSTGFLIL